MSARNVRCFDGKMLEKMQANGNAAYFKASSMRSVSMTKKGKKSMNLGLLIPHECITVPLYDLAT